MSTRPYDRRENSFHLLRFVLAAMVILYHAYLVVGRTSPLEMLTGHQCDEGTIAVDGFMVISGFLITQSAVSSRNALTFLRNRILRIYPALCCALVFTAFLVGGLAYSGDYAAYLHLRGNGPLDYILSWLSLCTVRTQWGITGVFAGNLRQGVNIPLWTLPNEAALYLLMALIMLLGITRRRWVYPLLLAVFTALHVLWMGFGVKVLALTSSRAWVLNTANWERTIRVSMLFFAGACLFCYREYVPRSLVLAAVSAGLFALSIVLGAGQWGQVVTLPYLIYCLGTARAGKPFEKYGDLSFGMYVYSYPLQQLLVHIEPGLHPLMVFLLTMALVLPLSALSWRVIERPALSLKDLRIVRKSA